MGITQKIRYGMLTFGILMGVVFPFYARLFTTYNEGMQLFFDIGCLMAGAVIGVVSFALVKHFVLNEVEKMSTIMKEIAQGDLQKTINIDSNDSIGALSKDINAVGEAFKNIIKDIRNQNTETRDNLQSLFNETKRVLSLSEESQKIFETVKLRTSESTQHTHEISEFSNGLLDKLERITTQASSMTSLNQNINSKCDEECSLSGTAVDKSTQAISHIESLVQSLQQINTMMAQVKSIASKTSLLALNANIEAASAGSAGQGFGVVANEVKELAHQSANTTEDIQNSIAILNKSTQNSVESIQSVSEINQSLNLSSSSIQTEVLNQSDTINTIVSEISDTSSASTTVTQSIAAIDTQLSEVLESIESLSCSLANSFESIKAIDTLASTVMTQSERLNSSTESFSI